jgi:uncharacterized membrane protein YqjE
MALLQALFALVSKSAGKILNAIFGWAVIALFGRTSQKEQTVLSGLVGLAAAWPLLLLGIGVPRITAFVLAFVPMSHRVPSLVMRLVWIGLALAVPLTVGLVVAAKAPPGSPAEPFVKRALRGFPITVAIAGAFLIMFVTVPALRIMSAIRGRQDEHVPLVTHGPAYDEVTRAIDAVLGRHALDADRQAAPGWLTAPATILQKLGGRAFRGFMPEHLSYWRGPQVELALYPSDLLIRGDKKKVAWAHGLLAEALARSPGLQTFDPLAQDLEQQIRRVWTIHDENPAPHHDAAILMARLNEITAALGTIAIPYDDWQVLYRQTGQLARALHGQPQLLEGLSQKEDPMSKSSLPPPRPAQAVTLPGAPGGDPSRDSTASLHDASTASLLRQLSTDVSGMARKQLELAKEELKSDLVSEIKMAAGLGLGGICGLMALNLLLVAAALGLATMMPAWTAALLVAAAVLALGGIAALVGWSRRARAPLALTRKAIKEDARWAKERTA